MVQAMINNKDHRLIWKKSWTLKVDMSPTNNGPPLIPKWSIYNSSCLKEWCYILPATIICDKRVDLDFIQNKCVMIVIGFLFSVFWSVRSSSVEQWQWWSALLSIWHWACRILYFSIENLAQKFSSGRKYLL